jgi:hypothetical protein
LRLTSISPKMPSRLYLFYLFSLTLNQHNPNNIFRVIIIIAKQTPSA